MVLWWALGPIVLTMLNFAVLFVRLIMVEAEANAGEMQASLKAAHGTYWIVLSYLVVPPVSLKLFQTLDCVTIAEKRYLRIDTSINCDSESYKAFEVVDILLTLLYLSIPLTWLILLWRRRARLNPPVDVTDPAAELRVVQARDKDIELKPFRFLYFAYHPAYFYVECIEMYAYAWVLQYQHRNEPSP